MSKWRWEMQLVLKSLAYRKGRTVLLLAVLAMASSLATALGIVSVTMEKRVADEIRKYGANMIILPEKARTDIGSGGLDFGAISEPVFLDQRRTEMAISESGLMSDRSLHLTGTLRCRESDVPAEGVNFEEIRRLFPWWQLAGEWPSSGEAVVGRELAARLGVGVGAGIDLSGDGGSRQAKIAGIVSTGGEEDGLLFLALPEIQQLMGRPGQISTARLLIPAGEEKLKDAGRRLSPLLPGAVVKEVRQVAHTSESLLAKVKLLMLLVTLVVLISAGASVTGTMSTTVLERGKEIGLLKAMGGPRRKVLLLFAREALLVSLSGGVLGYLVGDGIARFILSRVFSAPAEFIPVFVPVSLAVSLLLALLGSTGPLLSIFRLDPVRSLRGE